MGGITSHLGHKVILGSSIYSVLDFDLGMAPCDIELVRGRGGGELQQEDHLASN